MRMLRYLASAAFAVALCGAPLQASAQSFTDTQRGELEGIIKNYLIAHPEVLEESMAEPVAVGAGAPAVAEPAPAEEPSAEE